ncbi:MAG: bifunctional aspartate kinase/homoserine dehydrogenase I [Gammaproteobacteria bacterium]|nr:bifunctional aspartate kinase/homoserine dehydrogenase I [Gammaproteobacteria bacterium]
MNFPVVHKFGGSSLADSERFLNARALLPTTPHVVVVSAVGGVTQALQQLLDCARAGGDYIAPLQAVISQHQQLITQLISGDSAESLLQTLQDHGEKLGAILHSIALVKHYSAEQAAAVLSFGERWSARIFAALCNQTQPATWLDASQFLYTQNEQGIQGCLWEKSRQAWQTITAAQQAQICVVTGFIAATATGQLTLLERNGSDVSASWVAELCQAEQLIIWTDRPGIYSANPQWVRTAFPLPHVSYEEAMELAYFGAHIIHPKMIAVAQTAKRPIVVKSSFLPQEPGTIISAQPSPCPYAVRGLTSVEHLALVTLSGSGLLGVSGVSARTFQSLREEKISVIFITQASSEHSICFCVAAAQGQRAQQALRHCFAAELSQGEVSDVSLEMDCAIVAVVGEAMAGRLGIAGRMCHTLAKAQVNIRAIAQGSSERNISVVVKQNDVLRALRALHGGFYLSNKTIAIAVIGTGGVASALLNQLAAVAATLREKEGINLSVCAITNSRQMLLSNRSIDLTCWQQQLQQNGQSSDLEALLEHFSHGEFPHSAIIDCTANETIAQHYIDFTNKGFHIITPNKKASSGDLDYYHRLHQQARQQQRHFLYETTVCAGLPVIKTLNDLLQTGDELLKIEGVVSGSLSYIFSSLAKGMRFSQAVQSAYEKGYTEPDPRDDLSGSDVARKMVCLAREWGHEASMAQVKSINLVPEALRDCSRDEFLQRLAEFDDAFAKQMTDYQQDKKSVAYVGSINQQGEIAVTMQGLAADHPFANLSGTDNMIIFTSKRYCQQPLVIQGPGAGTDVTAAGVFADLLRLASYLGEGHDYL